MIKFLGIQTRASTVLAEQLRRELPLAHNIEAIAMRLDRGLAKAGVLSHDAMLERSQADKRFARLLINKMKGRKA